MKSSQKKRMAEFETWECTGLNFDDDMIVPLVVVSPEVKSWCAEKGEDGEMNLNKLLQEKRSNFQFGARTFPSW
eukprot:m.223109 g.223109  ORF g.223109 m.223109 type:complete len:74 (+) comp13850_c0_seq45:109-330(+)